MFGDSYSVKSSGAALLDCKPTETIMGVIARTPEETLIFNMESENQKVISEAVDLTLVPVEPENSPKCFPLNCNILLPVTGAHDHTTFETSGFENKMLADIVAVCVDGSDIG